MQDSSEQEISTYHWALPTQHTTDRRDKSSWPQLDLNPRAQQTSRHRSMLWTGPYSFYPRHYLFHVERAAAVSSSSLLCTYQTTWRDVTKYRSLL